MRYAVLAFHPDPSATFIAETSVGTRSRSPRSGRLLRPFLVPPGVGVTTV